MIRQLLASFGATLLLVVFTCTALGKQKLDRTVLPIQEPDRPTYSELDARNAKAPPRFNVQAPQGAPNVVIVFDRRHWIWRAEHVWWPYSNANT